MSYYAPISLKNITNSDVALIRELNNSIRSEVLERGVNKSESIDFSGIRSVSRAFAHGLICLVDEFEKKGSHIELINLAPEISKIIEIVKASCTNLQAHYRPDLFPKRVSFDEASEHFEEPY